MSYTTFDFSGIKATQDSVSLTVKNNGTVPGAEVAQLYLGYPPSAGEPPKVLRGFEKVMLAPGAKAQVEFPLTSWSTSIWDVGTHAWSPVKGSFDVWVGSSSRDIRLTSKFTAA